MKYFSAIAFILTTASLFSQDNHSQHNDPGHFSCGITEVTEQLFEAHPEQRAIAEAANAELEDFTRMYADSPLRDDELIIIPVVFHIIHANGAENISNAQVESAIDVMNADFTALNSGINSVVPEFQNIIGNVNFEFRLARLDPDGNCTNGIVRTIDNETYTGGENLKAISPTWGRESYLNIWVCNSIESGAAGYAILPGGVNGSFGAQIDGIVIQHNYVGDIGTSNLNNSHSLTHEAGHWANLPHTWGDGNNPGLPGNCNGDDGVADTPPTIGWTTCNLNGESCGSLDNVQNFMEYSYCSQMYTNGQKARMRAALNSSISQRNQLNTTANLTETGVLLEDVVCSADFTTEGERILCPDQEIEFVDMSFNGVTEWSWSFPGGTPSTSTQEFPTVTYASPGEYSVTLTASNSSSSETITKENYISILSSGENALPFSEGFETFADFETNEGNWTVINAEGSNSTVEWEITTNAAYGGSKSAYVKGFSNTFGDKEILQSPTYDLSDLSENAVLRFRYAYAPRSFNTEDEFVVSISKNCGENWSQRLSLDAEELSTVFGSFSSEFIPDSESDWEEVEITNIGSTFFTESFRFRFEFTSRAGNNIYIDNINLIDPTVVGLEDVTFLKSIQLFPNPATDNVTMNYNLAVAGQASIDVLDITGRLIKEVYQGNKSTGPQNQIIDLSDLVSGIYFVRLSLNGEQVVRRVVVQDY